MKKYQVVNEVEQLELLTVKEGGEKRVPAKRVDIVSLRMVKKRVYFIRTVMYDVQQMAISYSSNS